MSSVKRPYLSTSLADLTSLCEQTYDARVLNKVRAELLNRKTQGARRLEAYIDQKQAKAPSPPSPSIPQPKRLSSPSRLASPKTPAAQARRRAVARKPKHPPTEEQLVSINAFMSGESLKITAFAGAGKTVHGGDKPGHRSAGMMLGAAE